MMANPIGRIACTILVTLLLVVLLGCQNQPAAPAAPTTVTTKAAAPATTAAPAATTAAPAATTAAPAATSAAATTPAAAPEVIKLGISAPMTGPGASIGLVVDRLIRMAIDEVNTGGGAKVGNKTYRFEPVTRDDKLTADGAREAADYLVLNQKIKFILGTFQPTTPGAQVITEPNKVLLLCGTAPDQSLSPKFPYTILPGIGNNAIRMGALYSWLAKEHPEVKRVAIVAGDDPAGKDYAASAEAAAKANGIQIIAKEFYPIDLKDFSPLITRVLQQNPDGVDPGSHGAVVPLFTGVTKALYEQGFRKLVFGINVDTNAWKAGGEATKNYVATTLTDMESPVVSARERQIVQRWNQLYNPAEFQPIALPDYNIPLILAQAIQKAGTVDDTTKIIETMRAGEWDTIYGKSKFVGAKYYGIPEVLEHPVYLSRVVDGKITTFAVANGTME